MRGVDSRSGGYPGGEGANPPPGGRGRGMVLPAWMTNQPPQMGGPVSCTSVSKLDNEVLEMVRETGDANIMQGTRGTRRVCFVLWWRKWGSDVKHI